MVCCDLVFTCSAPFTVSLHDPRGMCAGMFFQDQVMAKVPYVPPESAKAHALWMWSAEDVEKNFKDVEVTLGWDSGFRLFHLFIG